MPIDTKQRAGEWLDKAMQTARRFATLLGRVFKPGGWRYLRPIEPENSGQSDETTEQLLKATERLAEPPSQEAQKPPRKRRAA